MTKVKSVKTMQKIVKNWSSWYLDRYYSDNGVKEGKRGFG